MIRTYTGIDFINYLSTFSFNSGSDLGVVSPSSQFNFSINSSGSNTPYGPGFRNNVSYQLSVTGDLDFDVFPAIPAGALISKVEIRVDYSLATSGVATVGIPAPNACVVDGIWSHNLFVEGVDCPALVLGTSVNDVDNASASASMNESDAYTNVETFDFSGSPISKADLILQFTSWELLIIAIWIADATGATGATGESTGYSFDGIRVEVTYTEGPISMTINPTGGNVQVGQVIVVTGPGVADLDYFFETEDGIIPVEPQIIGPDEVWIETPYPATDPCFDCFPSCSECTAALIPCGTNLLGEECQAAMQECLDCLTGCLEELELAEECQASTRNPPTTPVPVILIVGTQFSGNVPLGNFVILNADGSGLYKFVIGKTNDTIYDGDRDGTTYDVKIPNPGGKTGFFRS